MPLRQRPALITFGRLTLTSALVLGLYYVLPVEPHQSGPQLALRTAAGVGAGLLITWLIVRQVSHHLLDPEGASLASLYLALVAGVTFFALADYLTAVADPGQFIDLRTKTDALYFALTTLSTVGYGDIHAQGQLARGVVAIQLVFNLVVIATGASVLTRQLGARVRERHPAGPRR